MIFLAWAGTASAGTDLPAGKEARAVSNYPLANSKPMFDYKEPFLAGVLSWVMPGAGQIYARSYTKGSVFIFADLVDKSSLVLLLLYLNNNYKGVSINISWSALQPKDKGFIITYLVLSTTLKLYNSIDAIHTAEKYNLTRYGIKVGLYMPPDPVQSERAQTGLQFAWQGRL